MVSKKLQVKNSKISSFTSTFFIAITGQNSSCQGCCRKRYDPSTLPLDHTFQKAVNETVRMLVLSFYDQLLLPSANGSLDLNEVYPCNEGIKFNRHLKDLTLEYFNDLRLYCPA